MIVRYSKPEVRRDTNHNHIHAEGRVRMSRCGVRLEGVFEEAESLYTIPNLCPRCKASELRAMEPKDFDLAMDMLYEQMRYIFWENPLRLKIAKHKANDRFLVERNKWGLRVSDRKHI